MEKGDNMQKWMGNITLRKNQKEMLGLKIKVRNEECTSWAHKQTAQSLRISELRDMSTETS